jgi:hypothetical protein
MAETLNAHQLIRLAQCLTSMQASLTDYELRHYADLTIAQKSRLEETLTGLARTAGHLYAYSVQLVFEDTETQLKQLKQAAGDLKKILKTAGKIQQVMDIVSSVAALADAIISQDVEGIAFGIDQIIQMLANT